ncbi:hypothetical protein M0811_00877 [Anaeramoeba ignava]|uniref:Uncharacterized protein n=1 Tax=Anaeramoeba ignava TaxID=1746090 RepID=A0A9Q0RC75_ANAIG|nr:hypothetical protein M0811_00877 [Anaeramoeba ignava]
MISRWCCIQGKFQEEPMVPFPVNLIKDRYDIKEKGNIDDIFRLIWMFFLSEFCEELITFGQIAIDLKSPESREMENWKVCVEKNNKYFIENVPVVLTLKKNASNLYRETNWVSTIGYKLNYNELLNKISKIQNQNQNQIQNQKSKSKSKSNSKSK